MPKDDETYVIRLRIKELLLTKRASEIARLFTKCGVPTPDFDRERTDNGVKHRTSGVWHATTIVNIGRDPIDAGVTSYGKRSMGDQLRFSPDGTRELTDEDFRPDEQPKVVTNPIETHVIGKAHFEPKISREDHAKLIAILDERGGTQRGKPRSRTPEQNPLGGRVFDLHCGWPMYRAPYNGSFRYVCGLNLQSHSASCNHNHVNGPAATHFLLASFQQRVLSKERLAKLEQKIRAIASREMAADRVDRELTQKRADVANIDRQLETAGRNLALADTAEQHKAISQVFNELQAQRVAADQALTQLKQKAERGDINGQVALAMRAVNNLTGLLGQSHDDYTAAAAIFQQSNARLFLRFQDAAWGKRTVRKLAGGMVTFGNAQPPVALYEGPTGRRELKITVLDKESGTALAVPDSSISYGPGQEGDSSRNVNRGDRTPIELFLHFCAEIQGLRLSAEFFGNRPHSACP